VSEDQDAVRQAAVSTKAVAVGSSAQNDSPETVTDDNPLLGLFKKAPLATGESKLTDAKVVPTRTETVTEALISKL